MPALRLHDGRPALGARVRQAQIRSGSGSMTVNPVFPLIGMAGRTDPVSLGGWSHTGVEWTYGPASAPNANYACPMIVPGQLPRGVAPTALSWSWTNPPLAMFLEMAGIKGEILWSGLTWTSATTAATPAPRPILEPGLLFVSAAMNRSGVVQPVPTHSAGLASLGNIGATTGRLTVWRYLPGTQPTVLWTFGGSANHAAVAAIMR